MAVLTDRLTRTNCFWAGVALGCLGLSRENALALLPVLLAWLWLRGRRSFAPVVAVSIGAVIVLAPVAIRNLAVGGEFYLTTSQFGPNLYIGNHEGATGTYVALRSGHGFAAYEQQDATWLAEEALAHKLSPAEVSRIWVRRALDWVLRTRPLAPLDGEEILLAWNAVETFDTEDLYSHADGALSLHLSADIFHFGVLAPLGFLGIWLTRSRWRELWILYATCAVYSLSVALFYVFDRYRYPLVPVLVLFAGAGLAGFPAWWRRVSVRELWLAGTLIGVVVLGCNWPLVSKDAQRAATHYNLGYALQAEGKTEDAIGQYREALALEPELASAHTHFCFALAPSASTRRRSNTASRPCKSNPATPRATTTSAWNWPPTAGMTRRSRVSGRRFNSTPALPQRKPTSAPRSPRRAIHRRRFGTLLKRSGSSRRMQRRTTISESGAGLGGRLDEAIEHFETALRLRPDYHEVEANLARARALRGR